MKVSVRWLKEMAFEARNDKGLAYFMDAVDEEGKPGIGPTPMDMVLAALAGCTGMDVVSLLRRMGVTFEAFYLEVEAKRAEKHPRVFTDILLSYHFENVKDPEKAAYAVKLSQ